MAVGENWCISGQNMTTEPTHCFGCRQFENRHNFKTISLFDYAESQMTNSGD